VHTDKLFVRQQITNPAQSLKRRLGKAYTEEYSEEPKAPSFRQSDAHLLKCTMEDRGMGRGYSLIERHHPKETGESVPSFRKPATYEFIFTYSGIIFTVSDAGFER
jgi:hypothetical protein